MTQAQEHMLALVTRALWGTCAVDPIAGELWPAIQEEARVQGVLPLLENCGLARFARVATRSCTAYLGLPVELVPWCADAPEKLASRLLAELLGSGNMGQAVHGDDLSFLLKSTDEKKSTMGAFFGNLWSIIRRNYPAVEKYPILFPFCLVHRIIVFLVRICSRKQVLSTLEASLISSRSRESLYDQMRIFETEAPRGSDRT